MSATKAQLSSPCSVFVAPNNEIYFADNGNHRIRKILENGDIVTIAGNGQGGFSGDNDLATNAQLKNPSCVFVSSSNEVYISDFYSQRIRKILKNGDIVTIAGNGEPGYSGDNDLATNAQINYPMGVFVSSSNEVYISDCQNHRIRKILTNGNIITIAGNGEAGYSGDNDLATNAKLNYPTSVFVSSNDEVYIADSQNHRIRKISTNGIIETIAGNGKRAFSGDNEIAIGACLDSPRDVFVSENNEIYFTDFGNQRIRKIITNGIIVTVCGNGSRGYNGDNDLATNAILNNPTSIFVSASGEVYISDFGNNRIRKLLTTGYIETIAGNGERGYSGDSEFDFSENPHIGSILPISKYNLKKHERDLLFNSSIIAFIPLIEILSPQFCNCILKNESLISSMNSIQQEITQTLVDSLIYMQDVRELKYEKLDVLFLLGLFKNNEFRILKKSYTNRLIQSLTGENFCVIWEQIEVYLSKCSEMGLKNYILEYLHNYCVEFDSIEMKREGDSNLTNLPDSANILSLVDLDEKVEIETSDIGKLYNDKTTSDLKIQIDENNYWYCHKTILSSSSTLFYALLESGLTFTDLKNDVFIPDPSDDLELLEIVIKSCYEIPVENVKYEKLLSLLDLAMKHEMENLVTKCMNYLKISNENYFEIVEACENYIGFQCFERFHNELLRFGTENRKVLFSDVTNSSRLPPKFLKIFSELSE